MIISIFLEVIVLFKIEMCMYKLNNIIYICMYINEEKYTCVFPQKAKYYVCLWVYVHTHSMRDVLMSISLTYFCFWLLCFFGLCIMIVF